MKKVIFIFISFMFIFGLISCISTPKSGKVVREGGFKGIVLSYSNSIKITDYSGKELSIHIPSKIKGLPVTEIGSAFRFKPITNLTIPNSVTTIWMDAFEGTRLTTVTIPRSVTILDASAFTFIFTLTAINVASDNPNYSSIDGVLYNKDGTILLQWPSGKQPVRIPNSVTSIGDRAFSGCELTSITIPESVTSIGDWAFAQNRLTSITINTNVTLGREVTGTIHFNDIYTNNGRLAGTYTRSGITSTAWSRATAPSVASTNRASSGGNSSSTQNEVIQLNVDSFTIDGTEIQIRMAIVEFDDRIENIKFFSGTSIRIEDIIAQFDFKNTYLFSTRNSDMYKNFEIIYYKNIGTVIRQGTLNGVAAIITYLDDGILINIDDENDKQIRIMLK